MNQNRLQFIDALRGFAALYVVSFHLVKVPSPQLTLPKWIEPLIMNGGTGVQLFFVISAFTLCLTLYDKVNEPNAVLKFYIRRIFRIIPLYYLWLLIMIAWKWGFTGLLHHKAQFITYLIFGYNFIPGQQEGLVWASWTLGIEMVFYVLFPFIFKVVNNLKRSIAFFLLTLGLAALHLAFTADVQHYKVRIGILHQLPVFAVGIICFFAYREMMNAKTGKVVGRWLLFTGLAGFLVLPYVHNGYLSHTYTYVITLLYAMIILGLVANPVRVIVNRVTVFMGLISYSLYLNHPQTVNLLKSVYHNIYSWGYGSGLSYMICFALTTTLLSLVSYITYKFIEEPGMSLGRKLIRRINQKKTVPGQMAAQASS